MEWSSVCAIAIGAGALAVAWLLYGHVKAAPEGNPRMAQIARYIREGAMAYLMRQYKVLEACKEDIAKHCTDGTDGASVKKCFQEKASQMSDKCKSALTKGSKAHEKAEAAAAKTEAAAAAPAAPAAAAAPAKKKGKKVAE